MAWNPLSWIHRRLGNAPKPSNNCTPRVQAAFKLARRAADDRGHDYVGTGHIMLGMLLLGEGVALCAMRRLNVNGLSLQRAIEEAYPIGTRTEHRETIPCTPKVSQLINRWASDEARILGHSYIGTEHLLLGYLRARDKIICGNLARQGVEIEAARAAVLACLSDPTAGPGAPQTSADVATQS